MATKRPTQPTPEERWPGHIPVHITEELPPERFATWATFAGTYEGAAVLFKAHDVRDIVTVRRYLADRGSVTFYARPLTVTVAPAPAQTAAPVTMATSIDEALATLNEQAREALG